MLQEEDAVKVVDLMAKRARQEVFTTNFKGFSFHVLRFDGDKLWANDIAAKAGNGEAAFFFPDLAFGVCDLRIRQDNFRFRVFTARHVYNRKAHTLSDLWSSQANALRGIHGSEHVFGKFFELGVKCYYRRARLFQNRVAVLDDRIDFARWRRRLWRFSNGGRRRLRTRRFVGHSCRNCAASLRENPHQIFAEKYRLTQVQPWLHPRPRRRGPRTNRSVHKRPAPAPW